MALTDSFPTEEATGLSIDDTRLIEAGAVARSSAGVPRTGIFPGSAAQLVTGTAGMAYAVAPFVAVTSRSGNGVELVANDASASVSTDAAPGANSRIDVIWVRCQFDTYADSVNTPEFGVSKGTASATPTKPSIPAGALELATAQVTSTDTTTNTVVITQTARFTASAMGVVNLRSQAEQDAWTPSDGALAYRLDDGVSLRRVSGAWVPTSGPFIDLIGNTTVSASGANNVAVWASPGSGQSVATSGWFSYNGTSGDITVLKAGRYEIEARVAIAPVSGAYVSVHLIRNGSPSNILTQDSLAPHATYGGIAKLTVGSIALNANDTVRVWIPTGGVTGGSVTVGGSGRGLCEFLIRAIG